MKSKIVYVDMDDVIADFYSATRDTSTGRIKEELMWTPSFFFKLKPIEGSQSAIYELEKRGLDVWILSQPLAGLPESYCDKAAWIQKHFPSLYKKIILTQDKGLLLGDYLIDDNAPKWKDKFEKNGGKFVHFPYGGYNGPYAFQPNPEQLWKDVLKYFMTQTVHK